MRAQVKHVVHCSGYSLAEKHPSGVTKSTGEPLTGKFHDWEQVCIGDPVSGLLGRIPMALEISRSLEAVCLVWSTGATYLLGTCEAEIMMQHALTYIQNNHQSVNTLQRISVIDNESINTATSMTVAARLIQERFGNDPVMAHFVTSANHGPRLLRDALVAFAGKRNVIVSVVPSHTSYGHGSPSEVSIQELSQQAPGSLAGTNG
jgi:hypothetical protein